MRFVDMRRLAAEDPGSPFAATHPRTEETILLAPQRRPDAPDEEVALWDRVERSPHALQVEMRSGDIIVWDGLAATHMNPVFPRAHDRSIWFLTVPQRAGS
jgi:hypothetical protein